MAMLVRLLSSSQSLKGIFLLANIMSILVMVRNNRRIFTEQSMAMSTNMDYYYHDEPMVLPMDNNNNINNNAVNKQHLSKKKESKPKQPKHQQRRLTFEDLQWGEFLGRGSINIACFVTLPDWAYEQYGLSPKQPLLLKMTTEIDDARREIEALERMNRDTKTARRLKVLPLIYANANMANPFYDDNKSNNNLRHWTKHHKHIVQKRFRKEPRIGALVIPYKEKRFMEDTAESMDDFRHFLRSLLAQMAHAHRNSVTNMDLSANRNIFVDNEGDAVLFDWNGNMEIGEPLYDPDCNFAIAPPEAWFPTIQGQELHITTIHAFDVWQIGILLANWIFAPCVWAHKYCIPDPKERLRQTILAVGDNATIVIPVNPHNKGGGQEEVLDLAQFVGLDDDDKARHKHKSKHKHNFTPLLCHDRHSEHGCHAKSFEYLDKETHERKEQAMDLLQKMLRISPLERPTCDELLQHPFLSIE